MTEQDEYNPGTDSYSYNYSYNEPEIQPEESSTCRDAACIFFSTVYAITFITGVAGNALVIWIAGFKLKKSVNTTWYLSLAMSDFLYCSFLPFTIIHKVQNNWIFGLFMCKFLSFIMFLNMFSSIFLLVIISVDRCVAVMFPVWAQNQRTIRKASVMVILAWIISAGLSAPSAYFRSVKNNYVKHTSECFNYYPRDQDHVAVVTCRFVFGFVIPLVIIIVCYVLIIQRLNINKSARSRKPLKIMTVLIVTFFICWLPFHIVVLMELSSKNHESFLATGLLLGLALASINSCLNPFLYAFMGKDFKRKCNAILSKIENAIEEEGRSTARGTSFTTSGEGRLSTAV